MPRFDYSRDQERSVLEACFEAEGDGFIYYRDHLSPGVRVSADERAVFVGSGAECLDDGFHGRIAGRRVARPRRRFLDAYRTTLDSTPPQWALGFIIVGGGFVVAGFAATSPFLQYLWVGAGSLGVLFGLQQLIMVLRRR